MRTSHRSSGNRSPATANRPALGWARACYGVDLRGGGMTLVRGEKLRGRVQYTVLRKGDPLPSEVAGEVVPSVACLSPRASLTSWIEAPLASRRKAVRVLPTLLDLQLPFPIEDCVHAFLDHKRSAGKSVCALGVAATEESVQRRLELLRDAGVSPLVLDQEGLAAWSQVLREHPYEGTQQGMLRVVLLLAGDDSSLTIGCEDSFLNCYAVRADDLQRVARLVRARQEDTQQDVLWFLAGAGASDPAEAERVRAALAGGRAASVRVVEEPESFLARALATRALTSGPLRCNLRIGRFLHPRLAGQAHARQVKAALLCLLAGLLLCGTNLAVRWRLGRREQETAAVMGALTDSLAGYHVAAKGDDAIRIVTEQVGELRRKLAPFAQAFAPSLVETTQALMSAARRLGLRYEALSVGRDSLVVRGIAGDWNSCDRLADVLMPLGFKVKIDRKESRADESIPFTIAAEKNQ